MNPNINSQPQTGNWLSRFSHEARVAVAAGTIAVLAIGGVVAKSVAEAGPGKPCDPVIECPPTTSGTNTLPTNPGKTTPSSTPTTPTTERPTTTTERPTTTTTPNIVTTTTTPNIVTTTTTPNIVTTTTGPNITTTTVPGVETTVSSVPFVPGN